MFGASSVSISSASSLSASISLLSYLTCPQPPLASKVPLSPLPLQVSLTLFSLPHCPSASSSSLNPLHHTWPPQSHLVFLDLLRLPQPPQPLFPIASSVPSSILLWLLWASSAPSVPLRPLGLPQPSYTHPLTQSILFSILPPTRPLYPWPLCRPNSADPGTDFIW